MTSSELSPRFVVFVVVSLLTHILELAASGLLCHVIVKQDDLRSPWFSLAAGLLIIPLVGVQLASAVFLLRRKGETATGCETTATAVLHILQLGFITRHFAVLQEAPMTSKRAEVYEMLLLRLAFAFTSGCTLCLLQFYLILQGSHDASWTWAVSLAWGVALLSVAWALATYRRALPEPGIDLGLVTWPGTVLKMLWRAGEVLARILALGLFASLYKHWIFLVLGFHWIAMLACVCVPVMTSLDWRSTGCFKRAAICFMTSFAYVFAFLNTSGDNAVFRYTFFYVILFLENTTLVAVWFVQCSSQELSRNTPFVIVAAISFTTSIIAMIIYHKFFHIPLEEKTGEESVVPNVLGACGNTSCVNCKHTNASSAITHPPIPPRPGVAGNWLNQYQSAIYCGQYYKHTVQDSLLDSISDLNSTITVSSTHARLHKKLATINDDVIAQESGSSNNRQRSTGSYHLQPCPAAVSKEDTTKSKSPKSKWRKRTTAKRRDKNVKTDSDVISTTTDADHSEDSASPKRPVWLPSGDSTFANQLLTYSLENFDTADTADDERSSVATGTRNFDKRSASSLPPREIVSSGNNKLVSNQSGTAYQSTGEHQWYSDGYSTDRTLEWPNHLHKKLWGSGGLTGSHESKTDCYQCAESMHGNSDLSSIMHSISPGESNDDSQSTQQCFKHHLHQKHRHLPGPKTSHISHHQSPVIAGYDDTASHLLKTSTGLDRMKEQHRSITHKESRENFHGRVPRISSPASDPSYGPKSKKKHSPRRKQNVSAGRLDKSTSQTSNLQVNGVTANPSHLPQTGASLQNNIVLEPNEHRATELLQNSGYGQAITDIGGTDSTSGKTSDPRFTVRVMVVSNEDSVVSGEDKAISLEDIKKQRASKSSPTDVKGGVGEETRIASAPRNHSDSSQCKGHSLPVSSIDRTEIPSNLAPASARFHFHNTAKASEVIYENIWQTEQAHRSPKPKVSDNKIKSLNINDTACPRRGLHTSRTQGSVNKDAWYMCSESEDSALPPEVLSSSVDGFTASDNDSDASVEIVI
ncbi:hypothetical protein EGW08_021806 [Elysia chlorotica]|uniref:XK-related protein n=1 Tax=Elysia chlorotica TaxID=188477 RepID=A0A3S1BMD5_ELYCH|nr:hypothetical protein EGW08_021806 [Elysia chlorotica]